MPEYDREQTEAIIRALSRHQQEIAEDGYQSFHRRVERTDKIVRLLYLAIGGMVVATVWVVTINHRLTTIEKLAEDRKITVDRVNEMWMLKEQGRSNKEDFFLRKGYPAPNQNNP